MNPSALRIGILGHYGNDNLGDEAIIQAVIENLRQRVPGAAIVCFSVNPSNTTRRHGVPAYPVSRHFVRPSRGGQKAEDCCMPSTEISPAKPSRLKARLKAAPGLGPAVQLARTMFRMPKNLWDEWRFIQESRVHLRDMNLLLIAGSNQFLDNFGGVWAFPFAMLKWTLLGHLAGCKVAFVSIGAGPLTSKLSHFFVHLAMLVADYISFRDQASLMLATCRWAGQNAKVCPDLAFSLMVKPTVVEACHEGKFRIGVNPMPVHDGRYWHEANDQAYCTYVWQLARFCDHLEASAYPWFFYSTQPKDANVIRDVIQHLRLNGCANDTFEGNIFNPQTVDELVDRLSQTDILVATRFHGVVLPLMSGRPALGICYHRKTADVLDKIGLTEFHVHIDALDGKALVVMFQQLEDQHAALQELVRQRAQQYRIELNVQYERLLDLVPNARQLGARSACPPTVAESTA